MWLFQHQQHLNSNMTLCWVCILCGVKRFNIIHKFVFLFRYSQVSLFLFLCLLIPQNLLAIKTNLQLTRSPNLVRIQFVSIKDLRQQKAKSSMSVSFFYIFVTEQTSLRVIYSGKQKFYYKNVFELVIDQLFHIILYTYLVLFLFSNDLEMSTFEVHPWNMCVCVHK